MAHATSKRHYHSDLDRMTAIERECPNLQLFCFPEVGRGWMPLVEATLRAINEVAMVGYLKVHVLDLKEKYGSLRISISTDILPGGSDEGTLFARDAIEAIEELAEKKSEESCTRCGALGKMTNNGWIEPLCSEHDKKYRSY